MKWKTPKPKWKFLGQTGFVWERYEKVCFAWWPTDLNDGTTVWLTRYVWTFDYHCNWAGSMYRTVSCTALARDGGEE